MYSFGDGKEEFSRDGKFEASLYVPIFVGEFIPCTAVTVCPGVCEKVEHWVTSSSRESLIS